MKLKCCGPDGYLWYTFNWRTSQPSVVSVSVNI